MREWETSWGADRSSLICDRMMREPNGVTLTAGASMSFACCCHGDENGNDSDDGDIGPRSDLEDLCMELGPGATILYQG